MTDKKSSVLIKRYHLALKEADELIENCLYQSHGRCQCCNNSCTFVDEGDCQLIKEVLPYDRREVEILTDETEINLILSGKKPFVLLRELPEAMKDFRSWTKPVDARLTAIDDKTGKMKCTISFSVLNIDELSRNTGMHKQKSISVSKMLQFNEQVYLSWCKFRGCLPVSKRNRAYDPQYLKYREEIGVTKENYNYVVWLLDLQPDKESEA